MIAHLRATERPHRPSRPHLNYLEPHAAARNAPGKPPSSQQSTTSYSSNSVNTAALPWPHLRHRAPTIAKLLRAAATGPTWHHRARVWTQVNLEPQRPFIERMNRWLEARLRSVQPTTVAKDLAALAWQLQRRGAATQTLTLITEVTKGVRRLPASAPRKAIPLSPASLQRLLTSLRRYPRTLLLAKLCWTTASRVADAMTLTHGSVTPIASPPTRPSCLVSFGRTKTNQEGRTRLDHSVVVPLHIPSNLNKAQLPLFQAKDRKRLEAALSTLPVSHADVSLAQGQRLLRRYSCHSIKRGAAAVLWNLAASGELDPASIPALLKHRSIESSVAYAPRPHLVSTALGLTKAATALSQHLTSQL